MHASSGGSSAGDFSKGFGGFGGAAGQTGGFTFASASSGGAFSFGSLPPAGASFPPVQSIFGGSSAAAPVFGGADPGCMQTLVSTSVQHGVPNRCLARSPAAVSPDVSADAPMSSCWMVWPY